MTTMNNKNEKQITEASASVCLLLATALQMLARVSIRGALAGMGQW